MCKPANPSPSPEIRDERSRIERPRTCSPTGCREPWGDVLPGPSRIHLASFPPKERWDDWVELDSRAWPERVEKRYIARSDDLLQLRVGVRVTRVRGSRHPAGSKVRRQPGTPGSRGRNCAKGPATLNQITDPDRILYPAQARGQAGRGQWERCQWDEALDDIAGGSTAIQEDRHNEVMYHVGRPGEDGFTNRMSRRVGGGRPQLTHQRLLVDGRAGYQFWMGMTARAPTTPTPT